MIYKTTILACCFALSFLIAFHPTRCNELDPTPIDHVPYRILLPGSYALTTALTGTYSPLISIEVNDVVLDLAGYILSQTTSASAITINGGTNNSWIQNGYIMSPMGCGISCFNSTMSTPITGVAVKNICFGNCLQGLSFNYVNAAHVINNSFIANNQSLTLDSSTNVVIDNCNFYQSGLGACLLQNCSNTNIRHCKILETYNDLQSYGICSKSGTANTIDHCYIASIYGNDSSLPIAGIAFESEVSSNILNSEISSVQQGANSFGIFAPAYCRLDFRQENAVEGVTAWSSDGKYLATLGEAPTTGQPLLFVYPVSDNTFGNPIMCQLPDGSFITTVAWAPLNSLQGYYLAVGGQDSSVNRLIQVYFFDGSTFTLVTATVNNPSSSCVEEDDLNIVLGLAWSPDNNYVASAESDSQAANGYLSIWQFNPSSSDLVQVAQDKYGNAFNAVAWNQNNFIATAGFCNGAWPVDSTEFLQVYQFADTPTLTLEGTVLGTAKPSQGVSVSWSPDMNFIAYGHDVSQNEVNLAAYAFDPQSNPTLILKGSNSAGQDTGYVTNSVSWSCQFPYIAVGSTGNGSGRTSIYQYDQLVTATDERLQEILRFTDSVSTATPSISIPSVAWKPGEFYLAQVSQDGDEQNASHTSIYSFVVGCVMQNNVVTGVQGTGIEGDNTILNPNYAPNLIMNNRAVRNYINYGNNVMYVETDWSKVGYISNLAY